jgi:hypothetical protein
MRVGGFQQAFNCLWRDLCHIRMRGVFAVSGLRRQSLTRPRSGRISPDQACLEIAVMLKESPRFRHMAATARRSARRSFFSIETRHLFVFLQSELTSRFKERV